ncbi:MAG: dienelactone hydrolase family protein [Dehalococcoidia bacterium]
MMDDLSRRDFVAMSIAAGLGAAGEADAQPAMATAEKNVEIKTPDGTCDAAFIHPASGAHAAVIVWPDAFGLRPSMRDIGKRLAGAGYAALVVNPFYRVGKAPHFGDISNFSFSNPTDRAKVQPLMASATAAGGAEKDAAAFIAWLDQQPQVDKAKKVGVQGYCMGGPLTIRTMAAVPDRVGAGASFHGGGLVTDQPSSPHLLAPKIKGRVLIAVASNDDARQPTAKDDLKKAFDAAGVPNEIEVYKGLHGWCVADMPLADGKPIYDKPEAERAWTRLLATYKAGLV